MKKFLIYVFTFLYILCTSTYAGNLKTEDTLTSSIIDNIDLERRTKDWRFSRQYKTV